jgi:hypothetical protein
MGSRPRPPGFRSTARGYEPTVREEIELRPNFFTSNVGLTHHDSCTDFNKDGQMQKMQHSVFRENTHQQCTQTREVFYLRR